MRWAAIEAYRTEMVKIFKKKIQFSRQFMKFPTLEILTPKTPNPPILKITDYFSEQFVTFPGLFDLLKSPPPGWGGSIIFMFEPFPDQCACQIWSRSNVRVAKKERYTQKGTLQLYIITSKEPVCPQVELILKIITILLIIFLGFIKSKPC